MDLFVLCIIDGCRGYPFHRYPLNSKSTQTNMTITSEKLQRAMVRSVVSNIVSSAGCKYYSRTLTSLLTSLDLPMQVQATDDEIVATATTDNIKLKIRLKQRFLRRWADKVVNASQFSPSSVRSAFLDTLKEEVPHLMPLFSKENSK